MLDECPDNQCAPSIRSSTRPARLDGPCFDSRLTLTFEAESDGAGTGLTLFHERLELLHDAMPGAAAQVEHGWSEVVEKLATTLVPAG